MAEPEETIRKFLEGEEGAFDQIVRLWEGKVYSLAWRMLGNREDAQDVVQETFLSVFKSVSGLRDPGSFSTWIYRITLNHCRAQRRIRAADFSRKEPVSDEIGAEARISGLGRGPDTLETVDIIRKAFAGLSEDHRTAIILKEYIGLNLEELADVMECPLSTAKSRLYHGLREVQRHLKRMGMKVSGV